MMVTAASTPSRKSQRGTGRHGVDLLADGQRVVCRLGQQNEGEPEVFALGFADEKEAEDGEADQAGGDAVGVGIDKADIAGHLAILLLGGQQLRIAGELAPEWPTR